MKRMFAVLLIAASSTAMAAGIPDIMTCQSLYKKAAENPFGPTVGELDTIAVCAKTMQSMKLSEADEKRLDELADRLNNITIKSKQKLKDAE